ncbi:MAG TPA: tetratricopeptide repeat protein [Terriglobia bacterium]|nr:tetratricopeptide repeat protein [Terriglobia bacterium]
MTVLRATILLGATVCLGARLSGALEDDRAHLGAGLRLFDMQRYSEAAQEFQQALTLNPRLVEARYYLAVADFNERRFADSRQQFDKLKNSGYRKAWVTYYCGRLDLIDGNLDTAIQAFKGLSRTEPLQDELYYLGQAYLRKGEPEEAIHYLERQVEFNPRDFRAHNLLARAYQRTGKTRDAEREFRKSEELHAYYAKGQRDLSACRALLESGKAEQAWSNCSGAAQTDDIDKQVAAGMLFGEFHLYNDARELFERALELDPESPEVNYNLGYTYFQMKDYARARRYLETALRLRPDFFEALAMEGTALYMLHDNSAAKKSLERAHQLRPDNVPVSKLLGQLENSAVK